MSEIEEAKKTISPGDVVELRSGGPRMTALAMVQARFETKPPRSGGWVACSWFVNQHENTQIFSVESMIRCDDEDEDRASLKQQLTNARAAAVLAHTTLVQVDGYLRGFPDPLPEPLVEIDEAVDHAVNVLLSVIAD